MFEGILCRRSNPWKFKFHLIFPCSVIPDAVKHPHPIHDRCILNMYSHFGSPSRNPVSLALAKEDYCTIGVVQYPPNKTIESNAISQHENYAEHFGFSFLEPGNYGYWKPMCHWFIHLLTIHCHQFLICLLRIIRIHTFHSQIIQEKCVYCGMMGARTSI